MPSVLGAPAARQSKGMLQRLTLIEATEPGCDALLLDEPFAGLDPEGREWLAQRLLAGGSLAVLFAPPRLTRRASAAAAVMASLLAMVAVSEPLGALGGPLTVTTALTEAPLHTITGRELIGCASCVVLATTLLAAGTHWARVRADGHDAGFELLVDRARRVVIVA